MCFYKIDVFFYLFALNYKAAATTINTSICLKWQEFNGHNFISQQKFKTSTMPPNLSGKIVVVTGATKGIGKGIALQLGAAGAKVYITGIVHFIKKVTEICLTHDLIM